MRGNVSAAGAATSGTGFTVTHLGVGRYRIVFATAFATIPTITTSRIFGNPDVDAGATVEPGQTVVVDQITTTVAIVATGDADGNLADGSFQFVAVSDP